MVFTAGIGERDSYMRKKIVENLEFLGINIDNDKNLSNNTNCEISCNDARVKTLVIETNEELVIASETRKIIKDVTRAHV